MNVRLLTSSRHRASSCAFSLTNSSRGYCSLGKGAMGQSKVGMSTLWMGFECVVARQPEIQHHTQQPGFFVIQMFESYDPNDSDVKQMRQIHKNHSLYIHKYHFVHSPKVLPWKPPMNDKMLKSGHPGVWGGGKSGLGSIMILGGFWSLSHAYCVILTWLIMQVPMSSSEGLLCPLSLF